MPHLIIEYTAPLAADQRAALLNAAHGAMVASGIFDARDIKSRAVQRTDFRMGDGDGGHFIHAVVHLIAGRPVDVRRRLAGALVDAMASAVGTHLDAESQISCAIEDIDPTTYAKRGP